MCIPTLSHSNILSFLIVGSGARWVSIHDDPVGSVQSQSEEPWLPVTVGAEAILRRLGHGLKAKDSPPKH
eukprot:1870431-Amphidinium_carterae.1